jgi:hypothetical protein
VSEPIKGVAAVYSVKTLVDHGIRVTIDLPEHEIMQAAMFMECQRMAVVVEYEMKPVTQNTSQPDQADGKKSRGETKSLRGG